MKSIIRGVIIGLSVAVLGAVVLIIGLALNDWKFKGKIEFEMLTYTAQDVNSQLDVNISTGSVKTEFYDGENIVIEYPVSKNFTTEVTEGSGKITFRGLRRKWYMGFWLSYDVPDTVIKLPQGTVYDIRFDIDAGSAHLCDGEYGIVSVDIDAGELLCGDIICTTLNCDIDAGTVKIDSAECRTLVCEIDAGNTEINKFTCGDSKIDVDAGVIKIGFTGQKEEYNISAEIDAGKCNVLPQSGTTDKRIILDVDAGKVTLEFGV